MTDTAAGPKPLRHNGSATRRAPRALGEDGPALDGTWRSDRGGPLVSEKEREAAEGRFWSRAKVVATLADSVLRLLDLVIRR
jgi:hypothetical protein